MADILILATSGLMPGQMADTNHLLYPRVDYLELQKLLDIDVLNYSVYEKSRFGNLFRKIETQLRSDLYLTFRGLMGRRKYKKVFAMSERVGIPYAGVQRFFPNGTPLVSLIQSWSPRQEFAWSKLNLFTSHSAIAVHCQSMKEELIRLGADPNQLHLIPYSVDHCFFSPLTDVQPKQSFALSIGEPRTRDYSTLFQAVEGLPIDLLVAASGSWYAREKQTSLGISIPENVKLTRHVDLVELKKLYAQSQFVILPVIDSVASFGATGSLEAACMARPIIAFRSRGIQDYIVDGETGILVDHGDVDGLRTAIQYLNDNPKEAKRMGENARQRVEEELNQVRYVQEIANLLSSNL
jgi:glycosyltransferase involved in cell wall biosynthesis